MRALAMAHLLERLCSVREIPHQIPRMLAPTCNPSAQEVETEQGGLEVYG